MIKETLNALADSARDAFRRRRGLLLLGALYLLTLACVYYFFLVGVATAWQLALSALTALAAPLLLFMLLAATANFALPDGEARGGLMRRALRDFPKVLLLSLPVAALGWLFYYLLGKLQEHLPKVADDAPRFVNVTGESRPVPLHWQEALMSSLWILLFGVVLPLLAAHLWLSAARAGLWPTVKRVHRVAARAFAPRSLSVYLVGFFVFGLVTYFVLYTRTPVSNGWAELFVFALRLAFTFALTLLGWTITLGALARVTPPDARAVEAAPAEAPAPDTLPAPPPTVTEEV
jgi:hypothetical protein